MTMAEQIIYRFTWSWPEGPDPDTEHVALVGHVASMDLARVLEAAGATIVARVPVRDVIDARMRAATAAQTDDDADDGGYHPDASDRAAMGRLARRAFTGGAGRAERG